MNRAEGIIGIISRIFLGMVFLGALALLVFNVLRMPRAIIDSTAISPVSRPEPRTDRPTEIGNAAADAFIAKLDRPVIVPATGLIRVKDETFSAAYDELYKHRDDYYGREIELSGYVLRDDGLEPGAFLVGRDLLWCCENDKYFIGFLAFADGKAPEQGTTILVRGILEAREYHDAERQKSFMVPAIRVIRFDLLPGVPRTVYQNCSVP